MSIGMAASPWHRGQASGPPLETRSPCPLQPVAARASNTMPMTSRGAGRALTTGEDPRRLRRPVVVSAEVVVAVGSEHVAELDALGRAAACAQCEPAGPETDRGGCAPRAESVARPGECAPRTEVVLELL